MFRRRDLKKIKCVVFFCAAICIYAINIISEVSNPFQCLLDDNLNVSIPNKIKDAVIRPGKTIFLLETSCRSRDKNRITLKPRQGCAVESAAKAHPNLDVVLLIFAPVPIGEPAHPVVNAIMKNYKNVRILYANLTEYFQQTPVQELYLSGKLKKSLWPMHHLSDVLRYLTLWKFGGMYLDLDVITMKSLEEIGPNFSGFESGDSIAAGIMGFDNEGFGHEITQNILQKINKHYEPKEWFYNSIGILTEKLTQVCNTTNFNLMTEEHCHGFKIMPTQNFYPVTWNKWRLYFIESYSEILMKELTEWGTFAVHIWNKLSENEVPEEGSTCKLLAEQYCPRVYQITKNNF